jgi:hypothetical protein
MPDQPDFTIKNIHVSTVPKADEKGTLQTAKQLSYNVGQHGPFTHHYFPPKGSAADMKSDMLAQKAEIQDLDTVNG